MYGIQYRQTNQGQNTRSQLLSHIRVDEELTREELIERSGLSYDQVRRQTKNLAIEGILQSRIGESGQRLYQLRANFKPLVSTILVALVWGWSVPVNLMISVDLPDDYQSDYLARYLEPEASSAASF